MCFFFQHASNGPKQFELSKKAFLSSFRNSSSLILTCCLGCADCWFWSVCGLFGCCVCFVFFFCGLFPPTPPKWVSANLYFGLLFSCDFFFLVIWGRTYYGWHFFARSLFLSIDLIFHKFYGPWIKLEQDLAWQTFLTCTWKHYLPPPLLFTEFSSCEHKFAWLAWTKGRF